MGLSETMYRLELGRRSGRSAEEVIALLAHVVAKKRLRGRKFRKVRRMMKQKVAADGHDLRESLAQLLSRLPDGQADEAAGKILAAEDQITGSQLLQLARVTSDRWMRTLSEGRVALQASESQVRVILQLVADSSDEEA